MELGIVLAVIMLFVALHWKRKAERLEAEKSSVEFDYSVLLKVTEELSNGKGRRTP